MDTQITHMTIKEAAVHFNVSDKTIRRWIKQKRLQAEQRNRCWFVSPDPDCVSWRWIVIPML